MFSGMHPIVCIKLLNSLFSGILLLAFVPFLFFFWRETLFRLLQRSNLTESISARSERWGSPSDSFDATGTPFIIFQLIHLNCNRSSPAMCFACAPLTFHVAHRRRMSATSIGLNQPDSRSCAEYLQDDGGCVQPVAGVFRMTCRLKNVRFSEQLNNSREIAEVTFARS